MQLRRYILASGLVLALAAAPLKAERIILINGSEITAAVLKSDKNVVVIDLGSAVLRLARSDVLRIVTETPQTQQSEPPGKQGEDWQLYRTANLKWGTIESKAERFGESVVMVTSPRGQGSGFIISADGYLITNYHVIAKETRIKVTVFRKTDTGYEQKHYKKARIIALNPFVDLALLKIENTDDSFTFACLGSVEDMEVGNQVFAIGNPLGLTRTVSQGIISTKNRNFDGRLYIQTTTDINPGNSGGPLFNLKGEVIGVTSMGYLFLGGLNFAIPVDVVKRFIDNRDAFAYDEDNPNSGYRYLQPAGRMNKHTPPPGKVPSDETAYPQSGDTPSGESR